VIYLLTIAKDFTNCKIVGWQECDNL
jgi:hypothetical protein